ncbi:MAG: type I restriction-modification system endonuclease [Cyanobacteria bacterium J06606_4]
MQVSRNFAFLKVHSLELVRLGSLAEQYFADDPNTCLIKLRQFGEQLAQLAAAKVGLYEDPNESQFELLRRLEQRRVIVGQVAQLFHEVRKVGNRATHGTFGEQRTALSHLKYARLLGVWFHRSIGKVKGFEPGPFVPPAPPKLDRSDELAAELARLQAELAAREKTLAVTLSASERSQALAQEEAELRQLAEALLVEAEAEAESVKAQLAARLAAVQAEAVDAPKIEIEETIAVAQSEESSLDIDERETRRLIDSQLRAAGWEADSEVLRYGNGTRPQKGKSVAIAEWPTADGRADYVLFVGLQVLGVVEAKRKRKDVYGAIDQAKRYSRGYEIKGAEVLPGGPWGDAPNEYRVPFVFATNGRDFLPQLETKSGIWFCDVRRAANLRRPLRSWYSPAGLMDTLAQDIDSAHEKLKKEDFHYGFELRPYQKDAILAVEAALAKDQRRLLLAMATGTGKTKTCIALVYRLLKTNRFRRVLFLVDRTALGNQAAGAFQETRMESLQTFANIFDIKELKDGQPDRDTRVHIGTVQSFVKKLLYPSEGATGETETLTADQYDCIVVDECHRGYLLDKELSEDELTFRDFGDYVSKYRQVLESFDAVKIGLTATPALHTKEIFGEPVYAYSYREAVIDGFLIDHEPPIRPVTALAEDDIVWEPGDDVEYLNPQTGEIDLVSAPDEIRADVEKFNRRVVTPAFNQVVCEFLAEQIDPEMGKTLVFCVNDHHADIVTDLLKKALEEQYGSVNDDDVLKITGAADKPLELIRRYKNEKSPKIAVTVDLLTTGIDVPQICNLVFLRRVKSRILYEQMLGRATRLCDDLGDGTVKEVFRIFDPVGLYRAIEKFSTMKPVVVRPKISFEQLVGDLEKVDTASGLYEVLDQIVVKLRRKQRHVGEETQEAIEGLAGMPLGEVADFLNECKPQEAVTWLQERKQIAQMLDRKEGGGSGSVLVSYHDDYLRRVDRGYGVAEDGTEYTKPEDYLESFQAFVAENKNTLPALMVVTQRPRDLTRQQLKELRAALALAGYSEAQLKEAWRQQSNEEIAASIIGYVRQAALGDALVPYEERVRKAMKKILAQQAWTPPQRKWLERIGKQLEKEVVVDKAALDEGAFKAKGGFARINKVFKGRIEAILQEINNALWTDVS